MRHTHALACVTVYLHEAFGMRLGSDIHRKGWYRAFTYPDSLLTINQRATVFVTVFSFSSGILTQKIYKVKYNSSIINTNTINILPRKLGAFALVW